MSTWDQVSANSCEMHFAPKAVYPSILKNQLLPHVKKATFESSRKKSWNKAPKTKPFPHETHLHFEKMAQFKFSPALQLFFILTRGVASWPIFFRFCFCVKSLTRNNAAISAWLILLSPAWESFDLSKKAAIVANAHTFLTFLKKGWRVS